MRSWRHWPGICPDGGEWKGWIRGISDWLQIYEHLQSVGAILIYIQIFCALVGSLGKSYSGVPVAELAISLFALVAIESGSHLLFKVYVLLLGCSLLVDIFWFVLIAMELRRLGRTSRAGLFIILILEAVSCIIRLLSTFIWYRIYHLGISTYDALSYQPVAFDDRLEALNAPCYNSLWPPQEAGTSSSSESGTVAGSIYDLPYYSSLFEDAKDGSGDKQLILTSGFESSSCNPG